MNVNTNEFMIEIGSLLENHMGTSPESEWPLLSPAQSEAGDDKSKVACGEPGHAVATNVNARFPRRSRTST